MMNSIKKILIFSIVLFTFQLNAQGPPITGDKPIMLAPGNMLIKTLTEFRFTDNDTYTRIPIMLHYLPTSNLLIGLHLSHIRALETEFTWVPKPKAFGDTEVLVKYQIFRKDMMAKTLRLVAKSILTIGNGDFDIPGMSTDNFQNYTGLVLGYETIKYGISTELGYHAVWGDSWDNVLTKIGFGLPILKPSYPVNQINLYFEYQSNYYTTRDDFALYYSQGIQYAKNQYTFDFAVQMPIIQDIDPNIARKYSLFTGMRYVF